MLVKINDYSAAALTVAAASTLARRRAMDRGTSSEPNTLLPATRDVHSLTCWLNGGTIWEMRWMVAVFQ